MLAVVAVVVLLVLAVVVVVVVQGIVSGRPTALPHSTNQLKIREILLINFEKYCFHNQNPRT